MARANLRKAVSPRRAAGNRPAGPEVLAAPVARHRAEVREAPADPEEAPEGHPPAVLAAPRAHPSKCTRPSLRWAGLL